VVASGSGVQRAAGAAIAFAIGLAPVAARAGAWTEPQGSGLLIETLFGWVGDGAPWGDNPAVKQNREDAQTYVEYGVTNELTIFGQTALERYALSPPTADIYTGFDYSDIGLRAKLWSTGNWVFSGEATLFVPGAYDGAAPAQAGDTAGQGKRASSPAIISSSARRPPFSTANSAIACAPAARRTNGTRTSPSASNRRPA
jgi:hypothetical protein